MEDEIDLKKYFDLLGRRWKMIVWVGVIAAVFGLYQGLSQPKLYKATATLMLTDSGGGGLGSALSSFGVFGGGGGGGGGEAKLIPLLKSRVLAKEVAKSLDATLISPGLAGSQKLNEDEKVQALANSLNGAIDAKMGATGLLEITTTWKEPNFAAEVTNKYVECLGRFLNARALNINFQQIDAAVPSAKPFNRNPKQKAIIGFAMGLLAGIFFAFLQEFWGKIQTGI